MARHELCSRKQTQALATQLPSTEPSKLTDPTLQADELQLLSGLAQDAAGLLWELAAMHDTGEASSDMLAKSEQLQVGLVSQFPFRMVHHLSAYKFCSTVLAAPVAEVAENTSSMTSLT